MSEIPEHVDVILVGTSLTNSILAAACSRIGKTVLHLDKNGYYGGDWASFTFQQLLDWIKINYPNDRSLKSIEEELINKSRMFCIDLAPRFLYSNGPMVELLVKSNVARYHEFKNNIRILGLIGNDIHVIPCRRNEVFTSSLLSNLADKRCLMKFIELCIKYSPDDENESEKSSETCEIKQNSQKSIFKFLEERGHNETLREFIINSIAMVQPTDSVEIACKQIKKFMIATQRYGRSPFLFPLYGCGEFPQSFCRLSAVFGGIYCLNRRIENLDIVEVPEEGKETSCKLFKVKFSGDGDILVSSDILVLDYNYALEFSKDISVSNLKCDKISRAILITNNSVVDSDTENDSVSFLKIPPSDKNEHPVFVLELNSSTLVCPKGLNIVYLWTISSALDPKSDLQATVERVLKNNMENILWEFYYHQLAEQNLSIHNSNTPGLYITSPPCDDIDYGSNVREAETLFNSMCSGQEFLPRAPDPDELSSDQ